MADDEQHEVRGRLLTEGDRGRAKTFHTSAPDEAGFALQRDLLPNPAKIAESLRTLAEARKNQFVPQSGCSWLELDMVQHYNYRVLKLLFIEALEGRSYCHKAKILFRSYWHKARLIGTLQAARHVLDTSYVTQHILDLIVTHQEAVRNQYHGQFDGLDLDWNRDASTNTAIVKLLHLLCLMTFIGMPGRDVGGMTALNEKTCRFACLISTAPPEHLLYRWTVSFDDVTAAAGHPWPLVPGFNIDPEWLNNETCLLKLTRLYLEKLDIGDKADVMTPEWFRARADAQILNSFRDLVSGAVGSLQAQLDLVSTLHAKLLGGVATLMFAGFTFLWDMYYRQSAEVMVHRFFFNHTNLGND